MASIKWVSNRELRATIRERFAALRIAVRQRRAELVAELDNQVVEQCRAEQERVAHLHRRLQDITNEANRAVVALLREYEDLAEGGRWAGGRQAMFEPPRIYRASTNRTRRHRLLVAEVDKQVRQALRVLDRQQATLLRAPNLARAFLNRTVPAIVADLVPAPRLEEIEARFGRPERTPPTSTSPPRPGPVNQPSAGAGDQPRKTA